MNWNAVRRANAARSARKAKRTMLAVSLGSLTAYWWGVVVAGLLGASPAVMIAAGVLRGDVTQGAAGLGGARHCNPRIAPRHRIRRGEARHC